MLEGIFIQSISDIYFLEDQFFAEHWFVSKLLFAVHFPYFEYNWRGSWNLFVCWSWLNYLWTILMIHWPLNIVENGLMDHPSSQLSCSPHSHSKTCFYHFTTPSLLNPGMISNYYLNNVAIILSHCSFYHFGYYYKSLFLSILIHYY